MITSVSFACFVNSVSIENVLSYSKRALARETTMGSKYSDLEFQLSEFIVREMT